MIWRWFWREWRSPSLLIVWLSLTLAMACSLALTSISIKMTQLLNQHGQSFLAGDRVLRSSHEITPDWLTKAYELDLKISQQASFMTMVYANGKPVLASVKAVDLLYPLYGNLETEPAAIKPHEGEVLISPRLQAILNVNQGDEIEVGDTTLRVLGILRQEPDAGFNPFDIAPRILINFSDLAKTGAIQPGSRIVYRYMFAGKPQTIDHYTTFLEHKLTSDQRWISINDSNNSISSSLERADHFLLLAALLTLILSAAAVTIAMGYYCRSRYNLIAVLKTLGAGKVTLNRLVVGQWLLIVMMATITGTIIGYLFEYCLLWAMQSVIPKTLPHSGSKPILISTAIIIIVSLLASVRSYKQLLATQPLRVLRRDTLSVVWPLKYYIPLVVAIVVMLLAIRVGFNVMLWGILISIVALAVILGGIGWCALIILRRIIFHHLASRLAVNRLLRQPKVTLSQLATFSLSFMLLALLISLRGGLLDRWQQLLPNSSPNYYIVNIAVEQIPDVKRILHSYDIKPDPFYPVVLSRLTAINDTSAKHLIKPNNLGYEAINRELNITELAILPAHNQLIKGYWPMKPGDVSIEEGIAKRLNIKLGDKLTFSVADQMMSANVSSIRHVNWESLQLNFYFIFPPGSLDQQLQRWMSSFHYKNNDMSMLTAFNRQFPTVSLIDVNVILTQLKQILEQVSQVISVMMVLVILCGVLLLMAQVQIGMQQRFQEIRVYRILGATRTLLRRTLWYEFALLGIVSGATATLATEIALWVLQTKLFDFSWQPNIVLWLTLPLISVLLLASCGYLLTHRLLKKESMLYQYDNTI